eukprot:TRINITY_DN5828_c0_g1_i1.p1 TRINITY_DN5828_c0_g1~~TRINITY_DN5828_c0_g1_i1.p1  ORF type:complete len:194 (+),score=13.69 TRINITY_DN5828_c0_g1_i1:398-979(+)
MYNTLRLIKIRGGCVSRLKRDPYDCRSTIGPGHYDGNSLHFKTNSPKVKYCDEESGRFGRSKRTLLRIEVGEPGPGAYENSLKEKILGGRMGKCLRLFKHKQAIPGPTDYSPNSTILPREKRQSYCSPYSSIGRAKRRFIFDIPNTPGPGSYFNLPDSRDVSAKGASRAATSLSRNNWRIIKTTENKSLRENL